ncbi:MAG: hypothetical protein ACYCQI_13855 [Gammaproteobacteria bacterium]
MALARNHFAERSDGNGITVNFPKGCLIKPLKDEQDDVAILQLLFRSNYVAPGTYKIQCVELDEKNYRLNIYHKNSKSPIKFSAALVQPHSKDSFVLFFQHDWNLLTMKENEPELCCEIAKILSHHSIPVKNYLIEKIEIHKNKLQIYYGAKKPLEVGASKQITQLMAKESRPSLKGLFSACDFALLQLSSEPHIEIEPEALLEVFKEQARTL